LIACFASPVVNVHNQLRNTDNCARAPLQRLQRRKDSPVTKIVHTHDRFYLDEDRYENPKEIFKWAAALAAKEGRLTPGANVADIGCAAGEFMYYLNKHFAGPTYRGFDLLPELVEKAQAKVPSVPFAAHSLLDPAMLPERSLDVLYMIGVHSYFDEVRPWLENVVRWIKPGGIGVVFGIINPYPVDVVLKYSFPDDQSVHRPGWSNPSRATISKVIDEAIGSGKHEYFPFEMPFDMPQHPSDPVRSWTFVDSDGKRWCTNGLSIIQHQTFLVIRP
jgi:SAM-dependent methyltransferase